MRAPLPVSLSCILFALLVFAGCDDLRERLDSSEIEERLRDDPTRPGKVGTVVGVGVYQHARRAAKHIVTRADPRCALRPGRGETWVFETRLERRRADAVIAWWEETRRFTQDADGDLDLTLHATFMTRIGQTGSREMAWRLVGDHSYVGEAPAPKLPTEWWERDREEAETSRIHSAGPGALQALLDAVDGWESSAEGAWQLGSQPLRCAGTDEGQRFVDRFVAGARTERASLTRDARTLNFSASWRLSDQTELHAEATARIEPAEHQVSAPPPQRRVDVSRDRSYARSRALLEKLANDGLVELTSPPQRTDDAQAPTDDRP